MPYLFTAIAIIFWRSLALLATNLNPLPTFLALGVSGIFGYHFILVLTPRFAPPEDTNLHYDLCCC